MKILLITVLLSVFVMLLSRLLGFGPAARPVGLDGLATLELPASFHLADSREQALPVARRLRRWPYVHNKAYPDRLTYFLPAHDRMSLGGEVVPVLLRVTLYAADASLLDAPDDSYFDHLMAEDFHYDGQQRSIYGRMAKVAEHLYYAADQETVVGWFSAKPRPMHHFVLTDPDNHARLFLSAREDELSRDRAEQVLRDVQRSLRPDPAALARYFAYAGHLVRHREAVEQANVEANLAQFNQQLATTGLPPLRAVARYEPGRFVDVGDYVYGVNEQQGVLFIARLGTYELTQPATPPYFTSNNSAGRYLASFNQQTILQQGVPAGHEVRLRTGVSEPLWFPPEEFATFHLADLLREAGESQKLAQRQPDFVAAGRRSPSYWELSRAEVTKNRATLGQPADYRHAGLMYGAVTETHFTLHYVGTRTTAGQPPQLVFTLEIFDGSPRYRNVAADAQYLTVDASQGGQLDLAVAGTRYQVYIEPPAQGHLRVEPL